MDPEQLRNFHELKQLKFNDEKFKTATSIDQVCVSPSKSVLFACGNAKGIFSMFLTGFYRAAC